MKAGRFAISDADATFTRQADGESFDFWSVTAQVEIEEPVNGVVVQQREFSGTIRLPHPIPEEVFFKENGHPFAFDVEVEGEEARLDIDGLVVSNPRGDLIEFVAENSDYTKFNTDDGGDISLDVDSESIGIEDVDFDTTVNPDGGDDGEVEVEVDVRRIEFSGTISGVWEADDG